MGQEPAELMPVYREMLEIPDELNQLVACCALSGTWHEKTNPCDKWPVRRICKHLMLNSPDNLTAMVAGMVFGEMHEQVDTYWDEYFLVLERAVVHFERRLKAWASTTLCRMSKTYPRRFEPLFIGALHDDSVALRLHVLTYLDWSYQCRWGLPPDDAEEMRDALGACAVDDDGRVRVKAACVLAALAAVSPNAPRPVPAVPHGFMDYWATRRSRDQLPLLDSDPGFTDCAAFRTAELLAVAAMDEGNAWDVFEQATNDCPELQWAGLAGLVTMHRYRPQPEHDLLRSLARLHWTADGPLRSAIEHSLHDSIPEVSPDRLALKLAMLGYYHLAGQDPDGAAQAVMRTRFYRSVRDWWIERWLKKLPAWVRANESADLAQLVDIKFAKRCRSGMLTKFDPARHATADGWLTEVLRKITHSQVQPLFKQYPKAFPSLVREHPDRRPGPDEEVANLELIRDIASKIGEAKLSILTLRAVDEESFPEIARLLGISSAANAKRRYDRSIEQVRRRLPK
jgi:hypothetical protein